MNVEKCGIQFHKRMHRLFIAMTEWIPFSNVLTYKRNKEFRETENGSCRWLLVTKLNAS